MSPVLEVDHLHVSFPAAAGRRNAAVRDVSFAIGEGEILGMAGESGSGKSLTALSVMGLVPRPPAEITGSIRFEGTDLLGLRPAEWNRLRGDQIGMVFQEPMTALDPVFTVGRQLTETLRAHRRTTRRAARRAAVEMLEAVGIPLPDRRFDEYPHQLSGGMRQRVMIAIALICEPRLLIADEPTTAVDVTIQAQILELLRALSRDRGTAVLFITHDLGVVAELCDRMVTLYAGEAVEAGAVDDVLRSPQHPYTSGLLQAIPRIEDRHRVLRTIPGRVPAPSAVPTGCVFHPRCGHATTECADRRPELAALPGGSPRLVRCGRSAELDLPGAR
ncbi:ABC transporter ATP-binding protein [Pseudonocardia kunmingensis]|uniref:Peptide/nickel transport system ATP-binding protein n=1 Tax=Pseudonocardia kunmingensis TaxID=630975 RepID=A0A543DI64_9PSEU|nr:ABC transporter ATP-binding protein [Pseudonocardia kunmingensis]TQM09013.1 peptide/nickel transport system ATP-binding protein [Pseudonocardia kunmingensis]